VQNVQGILKHMAHDTCRVYSTAEHTSCLECLEINRMHGPSGQCAQKWKTISAQCRHCVAIHMTFDLLSWKLAHQLSCHGVHTSIFFVCKLEARMGRRETDRPSKQPHHGSRPSICLSWMDETDGVPILTIWQ